MDKDNYQKKSVSLYISSPDRYKSSYIKQCRYNYLVYKLSFPRIIMYLTIIAQGGDGRRNRAVLEKGSEMVSSGNSNSQESQKE
jgi:hypothetical protein